MVGIKRILIWLKRFWCRCGYGVHSPFAFDFITNVVYEKTWYYAYPEIEKRIKENGSNIKGYAFSPKAGRFLFRLVNRVQPATIIDAGGSEQTALYLRAAKESANYVPVSFLMDWKSLERPEKTFLYIGRPDEPQLAGTLLEQGICQMGQGSVAVIRGIYDSSAMKALWKRVVADERVGMTFDLYDLGILFFDKSKIKQHYVVNF